MKINLFALLFIFFISCGDDVQPVDYVSLNDKEIQDYLVENDLQAEKSASGLYYIIDSEGTGVQPTTTDQVRVAYKGYFTNGDVFDQSASEGISFNLQQVISGWTEGITYFKEGGSGMLLVPSHLGYGAQDHSGIPGGSVLIFEIDLIEVNGGAN
jgi:FKBP-type peptidyl-prolyl cis-trans isomerase FkpA